MRRVATTGRYLLVAMYLLLSLTGTLAAEEALPVLDVDGKEAISLDFSDATVESVLETIGAAGDLHFIFDPKVDLQARTSVRLSDVPVEDALAFFLKANRLFYVVRSSKTVLVAPETRQKRQEHTPTITRTFDLAHADGRSVITALRSLLQTRQVSHDERQNAVTITDTPGQITIAEEIIERIDIPEAQLPDIRAGDQESVWVGSAYDQEFRGKGGAVPQLDANMGRQLKFDSGETTVRRAYKRLARKTGVDILFDLKIDLDRSVSLSLPEAPADELLRLMQEQLGHFSVVWGPRTIYVAPDNRQRRMAEQHEALRFFYLANASTSDVVMALRTHLQARQIVEIPRLNTVIIRDNLTKLDTALELVQSMDVAPTPE